MSVKVNWKWLLNLGLAGMFVMWLGMENFSTIGGNFGEKLVQISGGKVGPGSIPTYEGGVLKIDKGGHLTGNFVPGVEFYVRNDVGYCINVNPPIFKMSWDVTVLDIRLINQSGVVKTSTISKFKAGHPSCNK